MQYAVQSVHPCPNANWGPAVRQQSSSSTRSLRALPLQTKRSSLSSASSRKEVRANAGQWLESSAQIDVPVPLEHAWSLWEDRTRIPTWMPWITSVEVLEEDPSLSKWTLSTYQFERQDATFGFEQSYSSNALKCVCVILRVMWKFSWVARNLTPLQNQKIHWRSVPGSIGGTFGKIAEIQNAGQIRFARKGPSLCSVKLTISYEVPNVLVPFANLLNPIVEDILHRDMERFRTYAVEIAE